MIRTNKEIRTELLRKRWKLSKDKKKMLDKKIFNLLIKEFEKCKRDKFIGMYWPIENEVDTIEPIKWLLKNKYHVCIPKIKNGTMYFTEITSTDFEFECWHSMKQTKHNNIVFPANIQLIIVPMIGFNKEKYRMGYGLNWYNNFLKFNPLPTIGIAYQFQQTEEILLTEKDIKLDKIITE